MSTKTQRTQRVENLIAGVIDYHNQGRSIPEIAEIFGVEFSTVYKNLQKIADANNVTRESLLKKPFSSYASRPSFSKDKVDIEKIRTDFDNVEKGIDEILFTIKKYPDCNSSLLLKAA